MKIIVLSGSPSIRSITKQYIKYLKYKFKQYDIQIIEISSRIKIIEKKQDVFDEIIEEIRSCDGVLWAYPVYYAMVPAQYKRFIELIFERNVQDAFKGKYSAVISTSINFMDNIPEEYINATSDDLGMKYVGYSTLNMHSIESPEIRDKLDKFMRFFLNAVEKNKVTIKNFDPIKYTPIEYKPIKKHEKLDLENKKIIILTDSNNSNNLNNMVDKFKNSFAEEIEVFNIGDNLMKGGCIGCLKCTYDYSKCAYMGVDDYLDFYKNKVMKADIIVIAGAVKDRYISSMWKQFFDRTFFNNHTATLSGKQMLYLVSGPCRQIKSLTQMLQAFTQFQKSNLVGILSDEYASSEELDDQIYSLCKDAINQCDMSYCKTYNFIGIGGQKVIRDEVYGQLRYPLVGDYRTLKKLNYFDYPHKKHKKKFINNILILLVTIFPELRDKILNDPKGTPLYRYFNNFMED